MSFLVKIQRNSSETIKVHKEVNTMLELQGTLREGSSIINPVILIEDTVGLGSLNVANYMEIPEFGRKYFIKDIFSVRTGLVQISGHVDVLSSFTGDLLLNKGIIYRQENDWNLYLDDGALEVYQNPIVRTLEFEHGFDGQTYVLASGGRYGRVSTSPMPLLDPLNLNGYIPGGGAGEDNSGVGSKTVAGLAEYAIAHIGCPYWYGMFGYVADASWLAYKRQQYPSNYPSTHDFTLDFGQQVFDCVGLIKGYRWSSGLTTAPVYPSNDMSQDVSAEGLYNQCSSSYRRGLVSNWPTNIANTPGVCLFMRGSDGRIGHVGVSIGDGTAVEATTYGGNWKVIRTAISGRGWELWGIPDWLSTGRDNT